MFHAMKEVKAEMLVSCLDHVRDEISVQLKHATMSHALPIITLVCIEFNLESLLLIKERY